MMNNPLISFRTRKPDAVNGENGADIGDEISIDLDVLGTKLEGLVSAAAQERASDELEIRKTIDSLSESAAALERHVTVIADGTTASRAHLDDMIALLRTELADTVAALEAKVNEHLAGGTAEIVYRVEETVRGIGENIDATRARATELHEETAARLERIGAAVSALDLHMDSVANDVSVASAAAAESLEALRRMLTDSSARLEAQLRASSDQANARIEALADTVGAIESQFEPLHEAAKEAAARVDRLGEQLERSNANAITTMAALRRELAEDAARAGEHADERAAALDARMEDLAGRIERLTERDAGLTEQFGLVGSRFEEHSSHVALLLHRMTEETTASMRAVEERIAAALNRFASTAASRDDVARLAAAAEEGSARTTEMLEETMRSVARLGDRFDEVIDGIDGSVRGHLAALSQDTAARADEMRTDISSISARADDVIERAETRLASMLADHKTTLRDEEQRLAAMIVAMRDEMVSDRARFVAALEEAISGATRRDRERVRRGFRKALRTRRAPEPAPAPTPMSLPAAPQAPEPQPEVAPAAAELQTAPPVQLPPAPIASQKPLKAKRAPATAKAKAKTTSAAATRKTAATRTKKPAAKAKAAGPTAKTTKRAPRSG